MNQLDHFKGIISSCREQSRVASGKVAIDHIQVFIDIQGPRFDHWRWPPAKRGRGRKRFQSTGEGESWLDKTLAERHVAMTWMQRLKRVFSIDIETCERCAGQVKIIACIEERVSHHRAYRENSGDLKGKEATAELVMLPEGRGPPQARLFD